MLKQSGYKKEFQQLLSFLNQEYSFEQIINEFLSSFDKVSNSILTLIVIANENNNLEFYFSNKNGIKEKEIREEYKSSYEFLSKRFNYNHSSLLIENESSTGYNLLNIFNSSKVLIIPSYFENNVIANVIIAKSEDFNDEEVQILELNTNLLSFAITNIKSRELNRSLEKRLQQSQKLETIGKLTSGMAHDFSNVLSNIFGSVNLLRRKVEPTDDATRLIDNIENSAIRAKDLTTGLLSFGKPTAKRQEIVEPNKLLNELIKVVTQTFPKKINFQTKIEKKLNNILGNATEIYQVLLNLCLNAKEAIPDKGSIELSAGNIEINEANEINFPVLGKGSYVKFSVKDTGSGIEPENVNKIFDPYFSTKQKETGSGLGLYVSYGLVKAHKGIIEVSSIVNEGTTFEVYIPVLEDVKVQKDLSNKIILLADDEFTLRDLLAELLEANDFAVITVSSGEEAIKVLSEEIKVDLVIIDYNMTGINGLETISKIREMKLKVPVILSSGSLTFSDKVDVDKLEISSIVSKPYDFDTMLSMIKKIF